MSAYELQDRPTLAPAAETVLDNLRRRIRQYVWLEGLAAAAAWLGVMFWATLLADWLFEPSASVRGLALLAIMAILAAIVFQLILRRAFVPISHSNAATLLERRFPQLNDSLLTAVVLSGRDDGDVDPRMLADTCQAASSRIADVELNRVFNRRPLWSKCGVGSLLGLSVVSFAILFSDAFALWTRRALALSDELWPRSTRLSVDGFQNGVQKVARGSDVEIIAKADAAMPQVPQLVEVRYRTDGGGGGRVIMERRGIARQVEDRFQEYAYTFRSVLGDIRFDLAGGDDSVRDLWIQVVDSPTISQMLLECELPAYIGRKQPPLPVSGVMQVPVGSRVTLRASQANKDLERVQISSMVDDRRTLLQTLDRGELTSDGRGFSYAFGPLIKDTTLLMTLTDSDGITARDPVRVALVAIMDQAPQIGVQLDGIGTAVTPQARIPVAGRISDDYGLGRTWFEYVVDKTKPGIRSIREYAERPTEVTLSDAAFEARDLALKPGQKLLLSVKAADLCDLGHGPNVSSSEQWALDVVTPDQLRAMLDARELVLRQRFEATVQEMTETRDLLARLDFHAAAAAAKTPKAGSEPDDEAAESPARKATLRLLRVQGALTNCRKSTQEVVGMADAFDDIRKQLINNRIDTEELKTRLQAGIADPLRRIATKMFPELEGRLDTLQAALDDLDRSPALRDRAQQQTDEILLAMRKVLDRMIELEDFNQAVDLLRNIIKMQEKVRDDTQQRSKQKIRDLLKE